jgi:Tol biopolymer transport system component
VKERRSLRTRLVTRLALAVTGLALSVPAGRAQLLPQLERASLDSSGAEGEDGSRSPSLSFDGRFVAFSSSARNLVSDDRNGTTDIFVRDRLTGTTERVSLSSFGEESDGFSESPRISPDGRFVVFLSWASNLAPGDDNGLQDIYLHDRETGHTERVSIGVGGLDPNDNSYGHDLSADGRFIVFYSYASNLVPGDGNDASDVFLYDRSTGSTERLSVRFDGGELVGPSEVPSISDDGRYVAFWGPPGADPNSDAFGILLLDRVTSSIRIVSNRLDGTAAGDAGSPHLSGDGRWLTFTSTDMGLTDEPDVDGALDVFLFGLESGERILVTPTDDKRRRSIPEDISADGRIVAFLSDSRTLLPGAGFKRGDVYVFDRVSGEITRANRTATASANRCTNEGRVSGNGHWVAFKSSATNLDPDDTNGEEDVFVGLAGFTCLHDGDCRTSAFCAAEPFGPCDVPTRTCLFEHKPDGTPCDDENPCTTAQSCRSGRCRPDAVVECPAIDSCHTAGSCDPLNGARCSAPPLPEGATCSLPPDGVACSIGATCDEEASCVRRVGTEDPDGDLLCSRDDVCPEVADPLQRDLDADGAGDACDPRDAEIRIERALVRWSTPATAVDGSVRITGILTMPPGVPPLPVGEPIIVRFTDGVRTDQSIAFAVGECRSSRTGSFRCRRGGSSRASLAFHLLDNPPDERLYRLKLRAHGLDMPGPFQPPLTLEVLSSPPERGIGVDRVGSVLRCRSTARGLRCVEP